MYQTITEEWADGVHSFRLDQAGWIELERKLDKGPLEIFYGLQSKEWRINWIGEVIRVGLIGAGMKPVEAVKLISTYVTAVPPIENLGIAVRIVEAALYARPKETKSGEPQAGLTKDGELTPPNSTEVQPS